jgi:twitching motility two-component system response regulator PilG
LQRLIAECNLVALDRHFLSKSPVFYFQKACLVRIFVRGCKRTDFSVAHLKCLLVLEREKKMSHETNNTKSRVLLVDDDKIIRIKATKMLEQCGCDVSTAENGWDAVTQLEDVKPDLILLDITMEPMDGFKTLTLIRASRGEFKDTPVVMLSSHDDVFTMGKSKDRGCSAYLEKPLEMEALQQVLQEFLAVREAS